MEALAKEMNDRYLQGLSENVETFRHRLTPAHIGLFSHVPTSMSAASWKKVETRDSREKGTYCVAQKNIERGDILIREQPFVRLIFKNRMKDHCHWCFRHVNDFARIDVCMCRNTKACCWSTIYCSSACEQSGWNAGHNILCRFPEFLKLDDAVVLALYGYMTSLTHGHDTIPGLVSNFDLETYPEIMHIKHKFNMFSELFYLGEKAAEDLVEVYLQIKCNAFIVKAKENLVDDELIVSRDYTPLGSAVYLSVSKLNHACEPNALVSFGEAKNRCEIKVQCTKGSIKTGQEVNISYGPLATNTNKSIRRKILSDKYYFKCQCTVCEKEDSATPDAIYKCQICKYGKLYRQQTKCDLCNQQPHWPFFLKTENQVEECKWMEDYMGALELQKRIYHPDTLPIGESYDRLAQMFCTRHDWSKAADYSRKSLKVAEKVYGKKSVEVAEEMLKLSSILTNDGGRIVAALKQIQDTLSLYRVLGLDKIAPDDVEELNEMNQHIFFHNSYHGQ